ALEALARKPFVRGALKMMHGPAHLAGLGELHTFLERGYLAFRGMGKADEFLESIVAREREIARALFAGKPIPE
ncbi:MAG: FFLEELY motif protein, partial [Betaproteobacteria bacterium]